MVRYEYDIHQTHELGYQRGLRGFGHERDSRRQCSGHSSGLFIIRSVPIPRVRIVALKDLKPSQKDMMRTTQHLASQL
ncbi:hypothetical protein PoB_001320600 [Plakobranchus ocellatus]|uniref:Uncharacterized protein n=1 Tax=Plakobranchus ocellatus TaxID=259542 RepID=A0AAV3YTG9_9GAST|nr:hypothetical protein PoB_001320600 [Plakobranchus ocellatus]